MKKIVMTVDGMMCGMCEAHVNDAVRKAAAVKSVESSHSQNRTTVIAEDDADVNAISQAIKAEGYNVTDVKVEPFEKRSAFSKLFSKK